MTCCDSHKVSSTGTKSQTRHQTQPYPHQDVSAQHSCPLQVFFSFLLFLPAKAEALPGLVSWAQVLIQTPHPAASHHSAPLELLFSFMGVLQNKSAQDFNSPSVPYTTQMESNTQLPLTEALASSELFQPMWVPPSCVCWAGLVLPGTARDQAPRKHPENTKHPSSTPFFLPDPSCQLLFLSAKPVTPRLLHHHEQDTEAQKPWKEKKHLKLIKKPHPAVLGRRKCCMQAGSASWQGWAAGINRCWPRLGSCGERTQLWGSQGENI